MDEVPRVRAELVRQQSDARSSIYKGVLLIVLVPIVFIAAVIAAFAFRGSAGLVSLLVGAIYALVGSISGVAMIASGGIEHRRLGKQLHDYDHVRQLPAARVVVR